MNWWYENEEEKMEFDKSRCYSAINADELRAGDKVIVADCIADLKNFINDKGNVVELEGVRGENCDERFRVDYTNYSLAYLVERKENCTNCENKDECPDYLAYIKNDGVRYRCEDWKPKPKEINMWNYTSEKLPTKQEIGVSDRVVVAIKGYNSVDVGYYDYELEAWFVDGNRYPVPVYAWMAIKPPKEEA